MPDRRQIWAILLRPCRLNTLPKIKSEPLVSCQSGVRSGRSSRRHRPSLNTTKKYEPLVSCQAVLDHFLHLQDAKVLRHHLNILQLHVLRHHQFPEPQPVQDHSEHLFESPKLMDFLSFRLSSHYLSPCFSLYRLSPMCFTSISVQGRI